jgi:DNA polymerase III epsilon subunit-like protein
MRRTNDARERRRRLRVSGGERAGDDDMTRLLVLDTETGGLNPETDALLSVGLVDWQDGAVLRQAEILVDAAGLACDPKALEVNNIDLEVHHAYSVSRDEAARLIREFCRPMGRPWLTGHNIQFDIGFVRRLFTPEVLRQTFSHRVLDTMQVLAYLGHCGVIPEGIAKLDQALDYFGITMPDGRRHTALADALATAQVYSAMLALLKKVPA